MEQFIIDSSITPIEVLAGDSVEFNIRFVVGKDFSVNSSRIVLDLPGYLGYSRPALLHNEFDGFITILCSNPTIKYENRIWNLSKEEFVTAENAVPRKLADRMVVIDFIEGEISSGDEVVIKWGYMNNGFGTGTKVSTVVLKKEFYNTINVRYFLDSKRALPDYGHSFTGYTRPVPDEEIALKYRILPRDPEKIRYINKGKKGILQVLDRFSNICPVDNPAAYLKEKQSADINEFGVIELNESTVQINPLGLGFTDTPLMEKVWKDYNVYFGDLHTHSTFSLDCIEREKMESRPDDMFKFARHVAGLDFMALTDHHEPHHSDREKLMAWQWEEILKGAEENTVLGEFVAIPGFEYRCERGDTVVIFNDRLSFLEIDKPEFKNIRDLWESYQGKDYITIPHFHNPGSLPGGQWYQCPYSGIEPSLEIFSCHESYERAEIMERKPPQIKAIRHDRNGVYFLNNDYNYGFICNSDGHKGHPGYNGLTAIYAEKLTPDAIFDALRKRRVYGTTNARIRLLFTMNDQIMGSILNRTDPKHISISVKGENTIKTVDIIKNGQIFKRFTPGTIDYNIELSVKDEGKSNWYVRITQIDNHIAYSSPIWFE